MNSGESAFGDILVGAVNRVFNEAFGEVGASFIYRQLLLRHGLDRGAIPLRIGAFSEGLVELLGSGGEAVLNMIVDGVAKSLSVRAPRGKRLEFEARLRALFEGCQGAHE